MQIPARFPATQPPCPGQTRACRLAYSLGIMLLLGWIDQALAQPVVIYDTGKAHPITDFIDTPKRLPARAALPLEQAGQAFIKQLFPIHTRTLNPGPVPARAVNLLLPQPFFIIGTDALSRQWLAQYRDRLKQLGAVGLVVDVESLDDLQSLKTLAGDLTLTPTPGAELAKQLSLTHYPVLVTGTRIEQ